MTNSALLEQYIDKSGLKKSHIAGMMGLSRASLSNKINGRCDFWAGEISRLCEILAIRDAKTRDAIFFARQVAKSATE